MTKAELIAQMAEEAEVTKAAAEKTLTTIVEVVTKEVKAGRNINLPGLGSFSLAKRKARKGRNPRTGETIKIAASKSVKFKPGKTLKDAVK